MRVMRRHQKRRNTLGKGQPIHQIISILSHGHLKYCYYTHPPPYLTFFAGIISNKCLRFKKSPGGGGGVSSVHTLGACVASKLSSIFSVIFILCIFFNRRDEESRPLLDRPIPTIVIEEW